MDKTEPLRRKSDSSECGMTAAPFNKDTRAFRITNDSHAIGASGDMLSIFTEKPRFGTGALYDSADSSTENLIRHIENHPFVGKFGLSADGGSKTTVSPLIRLISAAFRRTQARLARPW